MAYYCIRDGLEDVPLVWFMYFVFHSHARAELPLAFRVFVVALV